ncbi:hypothetical protein [Actinomadura decatromicini]|uniref:Uncharacterized protein n=1 Tax=Actinomadura decatromicini TaxID=2604572 RepID=A0A5D3FH52_9ACTN|nr:hypothetical protein [Actinomadura decatromicini]TYK47170.1 hypothetical protein FXF68_25565 [Actinomadura decatromicini]
MTDQTPDLETVINEIGENILAAARGVWSSIKTALDAAQDEYTLTPDPDEVEADDEQPKAEPMPLVINIGPDDAAIRRAIAQSREHVERMRFRNAARAALTSCLSHDDDNAALTLGGLDDAQLRAIEAAGTALAIHASRLRRDPGEDEQDEDGQPDEWLGASCTGVIVDEVLDLPALNEGIAEALDRWHEPGIHPDPAGMLGAVRDAIDPTLFGLRDRAVQAEQQRDAMRFRAEAAEQAARLDEQRADQAEADVRYLRGELSKADDENNATGERAKSLGVRLDETQRRAQRAEAEAAAWRTTAQRAEAERDQQRARADEAAALLADVERTEAKQRARAMTAERRLDVADRLAAVLKAERNNARGTLRQAETDLAHARSAGDSYRRRADSLTERLDDEEACTKRFTGYLIAANEVIGAKNWPSMPDAVRALRKRAEQAERARDGWEADAARYAKNADHWRNALHDAETHVYRAVQDADGTDFNAMTPIQFAAFVAQAIRDGVDEQPGQAKALNDAQANALADLRNIADQHPDTLRSFLADEAGLWLRDFLDRETRHGQTWLREFMRAELRRDPEWWRGILRRELRAGFLRDDFRRAGLADGGE